MLQRTVERSYSGVPASAELKFMTWFDIEEEWDYGYVEASSDGGSTWTKLPQKTALQAGVENKNGSSAWDGAGGLTGNSAGWQPATYDLTGFAGDIKIRFRYSTDEASNGQGWYVDDVDVAGVVDPITSPAEWTTDAANGWIFTPGRWD